MCVGGGRVRVSVCVCVCFLLLVVVVVVDSLLCFPPNFLCLVILFQNGSKLCFRFFNSLKHTAISIIMDKSETCVWKKAYIDLHMDTSETFVWKNYTLISLGMHQRPLSTENYLSFGNIRFCPCDPVDGR